MKEKELKQFQKLGAQKDYGLLLAADIRYSDFDRLRYLLTALEMYELERDLTSRHIERFRECILQHEAVECCDLELCRQWEQDFLESIPDVRVQERIRRQFEEPNGYF